ncbi:nucleotidyltransferase domain-containing protein [Candidatus Odyssella thessalonicensis]|uniref:nucleotidyltransferase domain-containing protein n=1 Tax=Candidatus Odyssella thessalonicensis TaxID=84647 RepID=UPI000225BAEF|nr:nucleotidyltransferase domain-containing protein [Candidatus Odyssella thessalonicensis]
MIKPSLLRLDHKEYVRNKLIKFAEMHNIRIITAIESGSRAWGFPSQDSDFDVRFIYYRQRDDYLSIHPYPDVLETPIMEDECLGVAFDLNGWDIRKALFLALRSNAVVLEWLQSPLNYMGDEAIIANLLKFSKSCACLASLEYHYDRLARHAWEKVTENDDLVTAKTYCYALRPALMLAWLRLFKEVPPMDIYNLCEGLLLRPQLREIMGEIISMKAVANEKDAIPRAVMLDEYINTILVNKVTKPLAAIPSEFSLLKANQIFKKIIL